MVHTDLLSIFARGVTSEQVSVITVLTQLSMNQHDRGMATSQSAMAEAATCADLANIWQSVMQSTRTEPHLLDGKCVCGQTALCKSHRQEYISPENA